MGDGLYSRGELNRLEIMREKSIENAFRTLPSSGATAGFMGSEKSKGGEGKRSGAFVCTRGEKLTVIGVGKKRRTSQEAEEIR